MKLQAEIMVVCLLYISLLWSVCEPQHSDVSQPDSFQAVDLGDAVTITCYIHTTARIRVWYKLTTGRKLQGVASTDMLHKSVTFTDKSHHYVLQYDDSHNNLSISTTTCEDAGTYYCGVMNFPDIYFGSGTFLVIKGKKMFSDSVIQQPAYEAVHPGDSVNLSCSVHTGHCGAEHKGVMWLKSSDHSAPEMIHYSENKDNVCRMNGSEETTCEYSLHMKNLSSDDAGTYFCVVTLCGEILFGNGTRISNRDIFSKKADLSPTVIALMASNIFLGMGTLLFIWTLCKNKKDGTVPSADRRRPSFLAASRSSDGSTGGNQYPAPNTGDAIIYAAVCPAPRSHSVTVENSRNTAVYSHVKYR